jgi:hypothetical protein
VGTAERSAGMSDQQGQPAAEPRRTADPEVILPAGFGRRPILYTTAICAASAALGHAILWLGAAQHWVGVLWQPVVGIVLVIVSVTAFGGFYVASQRTRIAIAASFLLTFLVSLTYVVTIQALADAAGRGFAKQLFDDFRSVVLTIIGFYFGTETIISVAKIVRSDPTAVQNVDRDLTTPSARPLHSPGEDP